MIWILSALLVVGGLPVGWAAAHLVHRYTEDPEAEVSVLGPATCDHCHRELTLRDTAPPRWWITAKGRCPHCAERLPFTWLSVQLSVPALWLATLAAFGLRWSLIPYLWLVPVLVVAATIDIRLLLIPKRIVWVGFGVGVALIALTTLPMGNGDKFVEALLGSALYFGFLFITHMISPAGMGFGDVRLAALLGLYLGRLALMMTAVGLFIACTLGVAFGLAVRRASGGQRHFPFGPGLAAGTLVAIWFWSPILSRLAP
ncbi:MAG: prepilin peptidase [Microthrixaceae bacterium]|nr:prepilin peptidase [Microthrixaceae bacterium]